MAQVTDGDRRSRGDAARRRVLGDAHVDRAQAQSTAFTADFQDLITRYAWGEIWTRPGLDVRTRRILVLGTLVALGRLDELAMHARAAVESGDIEVPVLREILLQQAVYCGVPAANAAFHAVERVLETLAGDARRDPAPAGGPDPT
jgi:4-carboxymuconolactone decarboxylase